MEHIVRQFIQQLNSFTSEEIDGLLAHMQTESFKKGDVIWQEGKISHKCYFVLQGCLRQYEIVDGVEKTVGFFLEGQPAIFYSSYLKSAPSAYYLSCVEDTIVLSGTKEQQEAMHRQYPRLEQLVQHLMLHDHDKVISHVSLLSGYRPEERYLLLLEKQPELLQRIPLQYIASFIGVTPESFSRIRKRVLKGDPPKQER